MPLQNQLYNDLQKLTDDTGHGSEVEGADQNGYLAEVYLIKRRCEKQRYLEEHQKARHSGEYRRIRDKMRAAELFPVLNEQFFEDICDSKYRYENQEADEDEAKVVF